MTDIIDRSFSKTLFSGCPVCSSLDIEGFFRLDKQPVHIGLLWSTRAEAISAPKADVDLYFCKSCGHVFNHAFDPDLLDYQRPYDNSLFFSKVFQDFARKLVDTLITRYGVKSKRVIEIGSGRGDFLRLLCSRGNNDGIGFDPSYLPDHQESEKDNGVKFIKREYSKLDKDISADLVCCRHTLEHLAYPDELLLLLRTNFDNSPQTIFYFEVPNFNYTLRKTMVWDLIYEHCHYFCLNSLTRLVERCGYRVLNIYESFNGQFLSMECQPTGMITAAEVNSQVDSSKIYKFAQKAHKKVTTWKRVFDTYMLENKEPVLWGAGAKGVCFLNLISSQEKIHYIVDQNPRKQGKYIPGSGQKIIPPKALCSIKPGMVLIMNPNYENEIVETLIKLRLKTDVKIA